MIASDLIHKEIANILVTCKLNLDMTSWNRVLETNNQWKKQGYLDRGKLKKYIDIIQKELNDDREIIIL